MQPVPFTWDFGIKENSDTDVPVLFKARCCLRGDRQVAYRDFDPETLYSPFVCI